MKHPSPPPLRLSLSEAARALMESSQLLVARSLLTRAPKGDGHPVMTLPGFGGADGSMAPLRRWLRRWGYDARGWGLGRNLPQERLNSLEQALEFRETMVSRSAEQLRAIYRETGQPVSLVGWSLGGLYASELAQTHADWIRQIITLGSPHGDPRGTAVWNIAKRFHRGELPDNVQDIEAWLAAGRKAPHGVPTTVIYSRRDGLVSPEIARLGESPLVENIEVNSSHLGFALNPRVYWLVAQRLARSPR